MTGVMGFLAQCEICPQKAILTDQLSAWVCPRCAEVAEADRAPYNPYWAVDPSILDPADQLVAVELRDGTIRAERYNGDSMPKPNLTVEKGQRTIAEVCAWVDRMMGESGFGDVDVAAAEPVIKPSAPPPPPMPLTIPMSDPLAAAIVREVAQRPDHPLIAALVGGRTFQFTGYTQRGGEPLETVWINEADLRTNLELLREPIIWGAPVDEPELPYKPPVKDHAYRAPVLPMSLGRLNGLLVDELLDDDDYPLGRIQG